MEETTPTQGASMQEENLLVCDICGEDNQDQLQECPDICSNCITDAGLEF